MEKIIENVIYSCSFCGNNYGEKEHAETHLTECQFNYEDNQTCYTCKHAIEVKEAPYPGLESGYTDRKIVNYLGLHDYIECGKKNCKLEEEELIVLHQPCWEKFEEQDMPKRETEDYAKYMELTLQALGEEMEFGEKFLEEYGEKEETE